MPPPSSQPEGTSTHTSEDDASATTSPSTSTALASFCSLPNELRLSIIELACQLAHPSSPPASSSSTASPSKSKADPLLDLTTTLSLLTVSSDFYSLAAPSLYRNVTLSRPSLLDAFLQLLIKRPQLGELVKSLRVGDVDKLPESWYPLTARTLYLDEEGRPVSPGSCFAKPRPAFIMSSLREEDGAPSWSPMGTEWLVNLYREDESRSIAIAAALKTAQSCIGTDLNIKNWSYTAGRRMSSATWLVGIIETQAILDLYILEMQRREGSGSTTYPDLFVSGYGCNAPSLLDLEQSKEAFVINRKDILHYLARPRCATDRFDHPLYPARLGVYLNLDGTTSFVPPTPTQSCAADDKSSLPSTATIPLMLDLLRALLKQTTQLESLSVSGFLEEAICRRQATPPPLLRALSVGRFNHGFSPRLYFGTFDRLEVLRIRNVLLSERWIQFILGSLPLLKTLTLDWRSPSKLCTVEGALFPETVQSLMKMKREVKTSRLQELKEEEGNASSVGEASSSSSTANRSSGEASEGRQPASIEIILHPVDVKAVLGKVSQAERTAWATGRMLPGQRCRLLIRDEGSDEDERADLAA